jgi:hypothetical protein
MAVNGSVTVPLKKSVWRKDKAGRAVCNRKIDRERHQQSKRVVSSVWAQCWLAEASARISRCAQLLIVDFSRGKFVEGETIQRKC